MKIHLPYVDSRIKSDRTYYYFRKRGQPLEALPGVPGTAEFDDAYQILLNSSAPKVMARLRRGKSGSDVGTVAWIIEQYTAPDARPWCTNAESTKDKYRLRFDWLRENYGDLLLASFDRDAVKAIRNKLQAQPSVANEMIAHIGQLWRWADEKLSSKLTGPAKLTFDPTQQVARIEVEQVSALVWPDALCERWEGDRMPWHVTLYYLLRFTGQRISDVIKMKWSDFDPTGQRVYVQQQKVKSSKIWVPCHYRLREHLATLANDGTGVILASPQTGGKRSRQRASNDVSDVCTALGFPGYTAHGLRHAAAKALLESGCTVDEAMSITGHKTRKQLEGYLKEIDQVRMADAGMRKWEVASREADNRRAAAMAANVVTLKRAG